MAAPFGYFPLLMTESNIKNNIHSKIKKGKTPLVVFPLCYANSPFRALSNDKVISHSAECDQRYARWISGRFLKKATQKLLFANTINFKTDYSKARYKIRRLKARIRDFPSPKFCRPS